MNLCVKVAVGALRRSVEFVRRHCRCCVNGPGSFLSLECGWVGVCVCACFEIRIWCLRLVCARVCVCVGECGVSLFFVNTVMDGVSGMQLQQHSA